MVLGTAFRRTGSLDLARDVAQEVFALMARKASGLTGHASLGGWLHRAAVYEASRALRTETRRLAREGRFGVEAETFTLSPVDVGEDRGQLAAVDEALGALAAADREALVLYYFQDLPYPEVAQTLGVNEAAARQRVSRALARLSKRLRGADAAAMLAGAVAIQSALAAPAGLAQAALAAAASTLGAPIVLALASVASSGAVKAAALFTAAGVGAAMILAPSDGARIAPAREQPPQSPLRVDQPAKTVLPIFPSTSGGLISPSTIAANRPGSDPRPLSEKANSARQASPPSLAQLGQTGRARRASNNAAPLASTSPLPPASAIPNPVAELGSSVELTQLVEELRRAELLPTEAARLYSDLLEEALELEPVARDRVEGFLEEHFERLNAIGSAGPRPVTVPLTEWISDRTPAVTDAIEGVKEVLSETAPDPAVVEAVLTLAEDVEPSGIVELPEELPGTETPLEKVQRTVDEVLLGETVATLPTVLAPLRQPR